MRMLALLELARSSIRSADQQVPLFCVFAEWDLPRFRPASIPLSALRPDSARIFCLEHHRPLDIPRLPGDEGILESLVDGVAAEESRLDVRGFIMMCIGLPLANRSTAQNFHGEPRRKIGRKLDLRAVSLRHERAGVSLVKSTTGIPLSPKSGPSA